MIPKVIHYCWFGKNPLNDMAKKCIESWKKYCPDYEIIEWNEENFDINNSCDYVIEAYQAKKWAFVTDYVRLYALYHHGGIYMDTDVELIGKLDAFLENEAFSGFENYENIPTAIMGSVKGGEWIEYLLSYYSDKHFINGDGTYNLTTNVSTITNMTKERYNIELNNTYQKIDGAFTLYEKEFFCPKDYNTDEITITENTVAIHHFNSSWHDAYTKAISEKRRYFINAYGEKGQEMYLKWIRRNHIFIMLKTKGIRFTVNRIIRKILR